MILEIDLTKRCRAHYIVRKESGLPITLAVIDSKYCLTRIPGVFGLRTLNIDVIVTRCEKWP